MSVTRTWLRPEVEIHAVRLTTENFSEVERMCHGHVRGVLLEPENRVVQFYDQQRGEQEICVGDWLVQFRLPTGRIDPVTVNQVWSDERYWTLLSGGDSGEA